jgi:hypothetical protein
VPRYLYIGEALEGTYSIQLTLPGVSMPLSSTLYNFWEKHRG